MQPSLPNQFISNAHLFLLSRFLTPRETTYADGSHWDAALGETASHAIFQFINDGLIEPTSLKEKLERQHTVVDLKALLKQRNLKTSGNKESLIDRLVEVDRLTMESTVYHIKIYSCTPIGREIAENFLYEKLKIEAHAVNSSRDLLLLGNFKGALDTCSSFQLNEIHFLPFVPPSEAFFRLLLVARPRILLELSSTDWASLRIATMLSMFWGGDFSDWLPANFIGLDRFDKNTICRMLFFNACYLEDLEEFRDENCRHLTIEHADELTCNECKRICGKSYTLEDVPELPFEGCTCRMGCRCKAFAITS